MFANLPHKAIASLWQNFNDYADGFGITKSEFIEICADLREDLSCSAVAMKTLSEALFNAIDTDHNNLIGKAHKHMRYLSLCFMYFYTCRCAGSAEHDSCAIRSAAA